jgi:hypothetical protein
MSLRKTEAYALTRIIRDGHYSWRGLGRLRFRLWRRGLVRAGPGYPKELELTPEGFGELAARFAAPRVACGEESC